jgi:hypothetical protein
MRLNMFSLKPKANVARLEQALKELPNKQKQLIRKTFYDIGKILVADTKTEINKMPKTGRQYITRYGRKGSLKKPKYYTASAPGEAPAKVTGSLYDSIAFNVTGTTQMEFGVDQAKLGVNYAPYLEYKNLISMTGQGSKNIKPRPFISAAYGKNRDSIRQKFANTINSMFQK